MHEIEYINNIHSTEFYYNKACTTCGATCSDTCSSSSSCTSFYTDKIICPELIEGISNISIRDPYFLDVNELIENDDTTKISSNNIYTPEFIEVRNAAINSGSGN